VERANRTLQDRLVKELRMASILDIDAGNTFLPDFLQRFNQRFAIPAAKPEDVHRPLNIAASRHRREQTPRPCVSSREGAAGPQAHSQGDDEQRKDWLPETNAHGECAAARAQRCPEFVTSV
jgi:hypothetical protein